MCLKVLSECGEDIPRFVSHYLDELLPVSFNHIDVSVLGGMVQIKDDNCSMKRTLETQTDVRKSLQVVTAALDDQLTAMEKLHGPPTINY